MIRTFVAVELTAELREALTRLQDQLRKSFQAKSSSDLRIQWVKPEGIHLTLKFLGDIAETLVEDIRVALAPAVRSLPGFTVEVGGLGGFPDLRAPRVLWVGITTQEDLLAILARTVDQVLESKGFVQEAKSFHPHLTLARVKDRHREIGRRVADQGAMEQVGRLGALPVEAVALMKSDLKPSGAVYVKLWEVPLGPQH